MFLGRVSPGVQTECRIALAWCLALEKGTNMGQAVQYAKDGKKLDIDVEVSELLEYRPGRALSLR